MLSINVMASLRVALPLIILLTTVVPSQTDPCNNYTVLDEPWRATNHSNYSKEKCDDDVTWVGWYRLKYQGQDVQMPESCVDIYMCGTHAPLWINGTHPQVQDGVVTREICGTWSGNCCHFKPNPIKVKACPGNYYVYEFVKPSYCKVVYCAESAQCCRVSAGVREERGGAVSYSNSECLMGSRLCNQIFPASYVPGAFGSQWTLMYNQQEICALEGSTVFMNGSYTYPEGLTVNQTFWTKDLVQKTDLSKDPGYSGRVSLTDEQKHFSLRLSDVMKKDEHQYCFRIKTNEHYERWLNKPGVQLRVTDLQVEAPRVITEGGTAVLTCNTTCSLTDPTFMWYKNGRPLTTKTIKNNQLHLQPVSSEDAGSYSCAVKGYDHLNSTAQNLRVLYAPKNISVSISPPGEIVEGSSVTLTCSSDANPPVKNYTWFKGSTPVGKGDTYNIPNIRSEGSGEYTCLSLNEHGERNSTAVQINVLYSPKTVSVSILPSGEILEGSSVTLSCNSDGNPPVKNYTWFKEGETSPVGSGDSFSPLQTGPYYCKAQNEHGDQRSALFLEEEANQKSQGTNSVCSKLLQYSRSQSAKAGAGAPPPEDDSCGANINMNETNQCCRISAGVGEERGGAVSYSNSEGLMGSRLCNQIFPASYVSGASGTEWSVKYNQQEICALEGSTVFMNGSYTHPENLTVNETFWVIDPVKGKEPTDLIKDSNYSGRVEYLTDEQKHFSLRLSDVMKKDEHEYGFRIITDVKKQRWVGTPGVQLRVQLTEKTLSEKSGVNLHRLRETIKRKHYLRVEAPGEVTEGQTAVLTCNTTCSLTDPTFTWYKNGRPLTTKNIKNNQLHLQPVSSEDAGSYSCAVGGYQHLRSTDQNLRVRYSPKNVSVSISPPGKIVEGSLVTLTCSSDGNPPVKIYTWFKGSASVGNGETYNIPNIRSEHSGEYTCQSRNEHGEGRSTAVQINVRYPPKNVSVSTSPSGETVGGSTVNLTCSSDANPPVRNYTWFTEGGSSPVGSGDNYSPLQSGSYYCEAQNEHGAQRSDPVLVVLKGCDFGVPMFSAGYSAILYGAGGLGLCVVVGFLSVFFWRRTRNISEADCVNTGIRAPPPDEDSDNADDYENITKGGVSAPPPDDDSASVNDYENIQSADLPDDDSTSADIYQNITSTKTETSDALKNVSVSISPPGEIVEGSSVTLTCSSDANPPVKSYTWFKGSTSVGNGDTYNIPNIRSEDSGGYSCQGRNERGEGRSTAVQINVQDTLKNVSVSTSPSGEIAEGSSVTLACSSDANPPVKNYTWFKEAGYSVILYGAAGVELCVVVGFLSVVFWRRTRNTNEADYVDTGIRAPPPDEDSDNADDYENVTNQCCRVSAGVGEERGGAVSYSNSEGLMGSRLCNQIFPASCVSGASGTRWSVRYNQQEICALKGSTVFMNGSYTHPEHLTVTETFWVIDPVEGKEPTDLSKNPGYSGRVAYLPAKQEHFSLRLKDVMKKDEHQYCFRIKTNEGKERWVGTPGVQLRVQLAELRVEAPGEVTEGQTAVLTCRTTCSLADPTFIWYKNGRPLTTKTNNQLHLQPVSSDDAGNYSCAVRGYVNIDSAAQNLRVRYSPKNVSVSISPPGKIVEGSSVTLICSSDGNPPVKIYTWLKGSASVGKGDTYNIPNIRSEHSGEYTCQSRNELGEGRSTAVQINVQYPPKKVSVSISPPGKIVEGSSVTLTCSSDGNPPVNIYTWLKGSVSVRNGGTLYIPNIRSEDSGEYTCQSRNDLGERRSTAVQINVQYPPKNVSLSTSSPGQTVGDSLVNLTCSSDGNPPVKNYTWFKEGGSSPVGSGDSYSPLQSGSYYCEAQNEHGAQKSDPVPVVLKVFSAGYSVILYGAAGFGLCVVVGFFSVVFWRRTRNMSEALNTGIRAPPPDKDSDDADIYENVTAHTVSLQNCAVPLRNCTMSLYDRVVSLRDNTVSLQDCRVSLQDNVVSLQDMVVTTRAVEVIFSTRIGEVSVSTHIGEVVVTTHIGEVVVTTHIGEVVVTTRIGEVVVTTRIGEVIFSTRIWEVSVSTHIGEVVVTTHIGEVVVTTHIGEVVVTTHIGEVVVTTRIGEVVVTTRIGEVIFSTRIGEVSVSTHIGEVVVTTHIGEVVVTTHIGEVVVTTRIGEMVVTTRIGEVVVTTGIGEVIFSTRIWEVSVSTHIGEESVSTHVGSADFPDEDSTSADIYQNITVCMCVYLIYVCISRSCVSITETTITIYFRASGTEWSVKYNQQEICALEGSTVFMNGSYTHPEGLTVRETVWVKDPYNNPNLSDLSKDPDYSGRVEFFTDKKKHFSLRLSDITKKDEHPYGFRIITNVEGQRWMGYPGVQLIVQLSELRVEAPGEVTEGGTAVLTCNTTCSLTDPTFTWYKNGRPLTTKTIKNNQLHLQTVSSEDAGSYSCAVGGYVNVNSAAQNLRVRYAPKNVSVSISPSGEIVEGSSVTLTCSSDANPPVKIYTWFKGSTSVGNGDTYNIPNIRSEHSGGYTCQSRNEHGEGRSTAVQINVQYPPKNFTVSISPPGEIVEGSSVNLTCSNDANPPVKSYTWFKGSTSVGNGDTYNIPNIRSEDSGGYTCQSRNEHGERRSTAVQINVQYPPKNVSLSISPPGQTVGDSSVNLTCSSDANPPVKNYTWFKEGGSSPVGSGYSYSPLQSGSYYCEAQNEHGAQRSDPVPVVLKGEGGFIFMTRNMSKADYVNTGIRTPPPDKASDDADIYENITKWGDSAAPPDDDSASVNHYEIIRVEHQCNKMTLFHLSVLKSADHPDDDSNIYQNITYFIDAVICTTCYDENSVCVCVCV
ncbi:hypothetical protein NFI96_026845 [Prochilodus magdalenae]|nr:hypothetical protein NFI96_026845 [Prochilodus magdalenae]